jgi:hypothetical protein
MVPKKPATMTVDNERRSALTYASFWDDWLPVAEEVAFDASEMMIKEIGREADLHAATNAGEIEIRIRMHQDKD